MCVIGCGDGTYTVKCKKCCCQNKPDLCDSVRKVTYCKLIYGDPANEPVEMVKALICPECGDKCDGIERVMEDTTGYQKMVIDDTGEWHYGEFRIGSYGNECYMCTNCGHEEVTKESFVKEIEAV